MKFNPYLPVRPFTLNQGWGTDDPKDYAQFGFDRHNGVDAAIGANAFVRAPFNGSVYACVTDLACSTDLAMKWILAGRINAWSTYAYCRENYSDCPF